MATVDPEISDNYAEKQKIDVESPKIERNGKMTGSVAFCLFICAFGCSFQFGWAIGLFNTPGAVVKGFFNQTDFENNGKYMESGTLTFLWSFANGLFALAGVFGGLGSGFIVDFIGRKNSMLVVNIFIVINSVLLIISKPAGTYVTILLGRFVSGFACGMFSGIAPIYLTEIPPRNYRGASGVLNQLTVTIAIMVTNIMGLPELLGSDKLWPVLMGVSLVPAVVLFGASFFIVESPKYIYVKKNDIEGAKKIFTKLRGSGSAELVNDEINEIAQEQASQGEAVTWKDMFTKKKLFKPLICTVVIQMSQQFSGINAVMFYSTQIFTSVGLDEDSWAVYATIILALIQVLMTFVAMVLIERAGRRILLLAGLGGMCIFSFGLAISRVLADKSDAFKYLSVVATVAYIIFFSIGPGAIPWLITVELFKSNARGKASSIAVLVNWTSNFIVTITFPFIEDGIGSYSFLIFGGILIFSTVFVFFKVPETKGKTVDQISEYFK